MSVRVRFAPSPTGFVHRQFKNGYTTTYLQRKWVENILRVEDTDRTRSVDGAIENMLNGMAWAGLTCRDQVLGRTEKLLRGTLWTHIQSKNQTYTKNIYKHYQIVESILLLCSKKDQMKLEKSKKKLVKHQSMMVTVEIYLKKKQKLRQLLVKNML